MRKTTSTLVATILVGCLLLASCSSTNKYIGEWERITNPTDIVKIYREGDAYIWESRDGKIPASFKDGQFKISGMFGEVTVLYVEKTDHIIFAGDEYQRRATKQ